MNASRRPRFQATFGIDIHRPANLPIERPARPRLYGHAGGRRARGKGLEGKPMWLRVLSAIEEMLDTRPPSDGEPLRSCRGLRGALFFFR